ncbi:MAG: ATP-binding cassette domain-containing protein [Alkaliphilus sp.]
MILRNIIKKLYDVIGVQLQETMYQNKIICKLFSTFYDNPIDYMSLLKRFDLDSKLNSYVSKLSGGQRQKLSVTLSLIGNPEIVFLDELTTGLDPNARRDMWEYIREIKKEGRTVFMTTHYMEEAEYLCDRICIINKGEIIALGTVEEVISLSGIFNEATFATNDDKIKSSIEALEHANSVEYIHGKYRILSNNDRILADIVLLLNDNKVSYVNLSIKRPCLDEAYIKLTGGKQDA